MASQITSLTLVYSTVYSGANQRKYRSSASLAFVRGIHRRPVISPHKWPVTRKMIPFDDVIMYWWSYWGKLDKPSIRSRSHSRPSILLIRFLFISHQSDQQFLRYSYFEIWPWNIHGPGHEWGQRSHIIPSIQPMYFLFVSHQLD